MSFSPLSERTWQTELWLILAYLAICFALIFFFLQNTSAWFWCWVTCWELVWKVLHSQEQFLNFYTVCLKLILIPFIILCIAILVLFTIFCFNLSAEKLLAWNEIPLFIWKPRGNKRNFRLKCSFHQEI